MGSHAASTRPCHSLGEDGVGRVCVCVCVQCHSPAHQLRCCPPQEPGAQGGAGATRGWGGPAGTPLSSGAIPCCPEAIGHRHQPLICSTSSSNVTELLLLGGQAQWEGGRASDGWSSSRSTSVPNAEGRACTGKRLLAPPVPSAPCTHTHEQGQPARRPPCSLRPGCSAIPPQGARSRPSGLARDTAAVNVRASTGTQHTAHSEGKAARPGGQGRGGRGLRGGDAPSEGAPCSERLFLQSELLSLWVKYVVLSKC